MDKVTVTISTERNCVYLCQTRARNKRLDVLTVVSPRVQVFWGVPVCHWVRGSWWFEGLWCL